MDLLPTAACVQPEGVRNRARCVGGDPQRLRELAAVAQATADELEEARPGNGIPARQWADDRLKGSRQRSPAQRCWAGVPL